MSTYLGTRYLHLYFFRYIVPSIPFLPSISDLLTGLGLGRSLSDDPQVLKILEKIIDTAEENMPTFLNDDEDKEKRSAQNSNNFTDFLKSVDQSLVNIRDAIRVGTQENSTLIQLMKDFDNALIHSTVVVNTDNIPVRFDGGLFDAENPTNQTRYADFRYDYR